MDFRAVPTFRHVYGDRMQFVACRRKRGIQEETLNEDRVSSGGGGNVLQLGRADGCRIL